MEFFQALQWKFLNSVFLTWIAYILIFIQPLLYALISKQNLFLPVNLLILSLIVLTIGLFKTPTDYIYNSNYSNITCTSIGNNGHLAWRFKVMNINTTPNHFVYILFVGSYILKMNKQLKLTIGIGWILSLIISIIKVKNTIELPAYWCLMSITADIPILLSLIF